MTYVAFLFYVQVWMMNDIHGDRSITGVVHLAPPPVVTGHHQPFLLLHLDTALVRVRLHVHLKTWINFLLFS